MFSLPPFINSVFHFYIVLDKTYLRSILKLVKPKVKRKTMQRGGRIQGRGGDRSSGDRVNVRDRSGYQIDREVEKRLFPDMRIIRQASVFSKEAVFNRKSGIRDYLDEFGSYHHGDGYTFTLGNLAVSYVNAREMRAMLADRYPRDHSTPGKARQLYLGVYKTIESFIKESDALVSRTLLDADEWQLATQASEDLVELGITAVMPDIDLVEMRAASNRLWLPGRFAIRGIEPYGTSKLGFDLDLPDNRAIHDEYHEIKDFLRRDLKLSVGEMYHDFSPHITFFNGFQQIGDVSLRHVDVTPEIMLDRPGALVNLKN